MSELAFYPFESSPAGGRGPKLLADEIGGVFHATCNEAETALLKFYGLAMSQRPFPRRMDGVSQPFTPHVGRRG